MTLDEAIRHCEEVADRKRYVECGKEHRQLAEWLKELKAYKEKETCETCRHYKAYQHGADITTMDDECGGCCSWNSKWIPNTCGDAVSRKYILDLIDTKGANLDDDLLIVEQWIEDAPSVTPQPIECEERKSGNCPFYAN